jgi:hypothetical protein
VEILNEALGTVFVPVLAVSLLAPWRWVKWVTVGVLVLIATRRLWLTRKLRRSRG